MLVNHHHARLEDARLRVGRRRINQPLHIVRQHHVVSAHDRDQLVLHEGEAFAVVAVRAQVLLVAHIGDALIIE